MWRLKAFVRSALSLVATPGASVGRAGAALAPSPAPPPPRRLDAHDYGAELDAAINAIRSPGTPAQSAIHEAGLLRVQAVPLDAPASRLRELGLTPQTLYDVGARFFNGDGVPTNKHRAMLLWKLAATPLQGFRGEDSGAEAARPDPRAMYSYAMAFKAGVRDGAESDGGTATALRFLKTAASPEYGDARSMAALGHSFETGDLTGAEGGADGRQAMRWYLESAKRGGGAQPLVAIGLLLKHGAAGLPPNPGRAVQLLKSAVEMATAETAAAAAARRQPGGASSSSSSSSSPSSSILALLSAHVALNELYCAEGPEQDWAKGFEAIRAAVQAVRAPHALWVLGNHYYFARGVEHSPQEAARVWEEVRACVRAAFCFCWRGAGVGAPACCVYRPMCA
jgi:TPR repeat protein